MGDGDHLRYQARSEFDRADGHHWDEDRFRIVVERLVQFISAESDAVV
jgi:hypothetical protein